MRKNTIFVIVLVVISFIGLQSAGAQKTTAITPADQEFKFAEDYWTPEKMRSAKPVPFYKGNGGSEKEPFDYKQLGPAGSIAGGLPGDNREKPVVYENISSENGNFGYSEDFGTKDIFDDTYINKQTTLQTQFPFKAIGKLFMNLGTAAYSCSASVISAKDIIVTAAHCCYDRAAKKWFSNFRFVPAFRNGSGPYGTYNWKSVRVLTSWISSGGRQNDVCLIRLNTDVSVKTGNLGLSWNYPAVQHYNAFGYPTNFGSGQYLFNCQAEGYANCGSTTVNAMGCSMTYGSSGGPWIRSIELFTAGANNYVNGVVSGWDSCTGTFGKSFNGPRFTSNNIVPLCTAEGGC